MMMALYSDVFMLVGVEWYWVVNCTTWVSGKQSQERLGPAGWPPR